MGCLCTIFLNFLRLLCFLYNHDGLCEISENFSWQTIWDLSENFQLQEIYRYDEEIRIIKIFNFKRIFYTYGVFSFIYEISGILCFLYNHDGLCEIAEKFPWQTIWDLSENSCSKKYTDMRRKVDFSKTLNFKRNSYIYSIYIHFMRFYRLLCFLYNHDGLCEIPEKFLWQTIWDLSEISSSKKYTNMRRKVDFSKNLILRTKLYTFVFIMYTFWGFQTFVFFV